MKSRPATVTAATNHPAPLNKPRAFGALKDFAVGNQLVSIGRRNYPLSLAEPFSTVTFCKVGTVTKQVEYFYQSEAQRDADFAAFGQAEAGRYVEQFLTMLGRWTDNQQLNSNTLPC